MPIKKVNQYDPRVQRTHELLMRSFEALLSEKRAIASISVGDIAQRATVNRATFYAHFTNKEALLHCWIKEKFQEFVLPKLADQDQVGQTRLQVVARVIFEFIALVQSHRKRINRSFDPLFDAVLQQEIYQLVLGILQTTRKGQGRQQQRLANMISWTIFGAAMQRSGRAHKENVEEVIEFIMNGLSQH